MLFGVGEKFGMFIGCFGWGLGHLYINIITLAALIFRQTFALLLVLGLLLVCCHVVCIDVRDSVGCCDRN